jgi:hypothetical protein
VRLSKTLDAKKRLGIFLVAILTIVGTLVLITPGAASAAAHCSGALIDSKPLTLPGRWSPGTMYLYNNSSTGKNCAWASNETGVSHQMSIVLYRCSNHSTTTCNGFEDINSTNTDSGRYTSYVGPVNTLGSAAGMCIFAQAVLGLDNGADYTATIRGHCG